MMTCRRCGAQIHNDPAPDGTPAWVDNSGGDVCGLNGDNEPHAPERDDMNLAERITRDGITIESRSGTYTIPDTHVPGTEAWEVTLHAEERVLTTPFFTGPGLHEEMRHGPSAEDVLSCLLADAALWENAAGFEDWCAEFGMEADAANHRKFQQVEKQTNELRAFLGEQYEAYLWETNEG